MFYQGALHCLKSLKENYATLLESTSPDLFHFFLQILEEILCS